MSFIQIVSALRPYGADVLLLALAVTLLAALLKKTVLQHCSGKVFLFLPFAIGLVLYAAYSAAASGSAVPFTSGICKTLEGGFACGCAATLYYNIYKQFRGETLPVLYPLLEMIPEERRAEVAERLYLDATALPEEEREAYLFEALSEEAPGLTEEERLAAAAVIARFLSEL